LRPFSIGYGLALLGLWLAGLVYVWYQGELFHLPADPSLLRNMVYFPRLRLPGTAAEQGAPLADKEFTAPHMEA
jgi:hypothetical protein